MKIQKLLIAGIGGQGVVYLTNLITEAALLADITVASSEIHGLAQRRGSVVSSVTFGDNSFGYVEEAGADYLIGLEPLEAQRYLNFLNSESRVVIDDHAIFPHAVNSGKVVYPDVSSFVSYLQINIAQVIFNSGFPADLNPIYRNVFLLGRTMRLEDFPLGQSHIERAIELTVRSNLIDETKRAFQLGCDFEENEC